MTVARCFFAAEIQVDLERSCEVHSHACAEIVYYLKGSGHLLQKGKRLHYQPGFAAVYQP